MSKITKLEKDIRLFRPLLSENKTDLVILAKVFLKKSLRTQVIKMKNIYEQKLED